MSVEDNPDYRNADGEWEEQITWSHWYRPNGDKVEAIEQPQYTLEEIRAKYPEAEKVIANRGISQTREQQYGRIQDQLDKIYHDIANGTLDQTGDWFTSIKGVKDANPFQE